MAFFSDTAFEGNTFSTSAPARRELQSAVVALEHHGRVVIVGGPKSGKTFLAHALLHHFRTRFATHIICSARSLNKHLDEGRPRILLMDGTLGEVCVDMEEYKVWRALLPRLMTCTDIRHCLVVVTCYPHVLLELQALEEGSHSFLLQDTCTVSLKEMAQDEKKVMLQSFLSDLTMTQQEKHELVERVLKDDISGATFPWCCARLVQRLHISSLDDASDVFTTPAESYVTLLHRMLMDPTHGETLAALLCLTMMGLSHFYGNQHNTHTTLTGLGFREISADCLEKSASFLKSFILSEDYTAFYSRVLYDAAGLALGRSHRLPVLLKICDMDFLIKYVRVLTEPSNLFPTITLNPKNTVHVMERILTEITNGKLIEISQYLSLQGELFLEKLEEYNRTRKSGEIQILQAVDTVHGLSLLYWSAWTGCDWLVNWCLDLCCKNTRTYTSLLQSAFVWVLIQRTKCSEKIKSQGAKLLQSIQKFQSEYNGWISSLSLPFPHKTLFLYEQPRSGCDQVLTYTNLVYLGDSSLAIPQSALIIENKGESLFVEFRKKHVYLAIRLLYDTEAGQVDGDGNTLLHVAAEAGDEDVVEFIVKSGASLTARNNINLTPPQVAQRHNTGGGYRREGKNIHKVCQDNDMVTVKVLLCCGVSVDHGDSKNRTALHVACQEGHTDLVNLFVEIGAEVNAKDKDGSTALHLACDKGRDEIASLLIEHGADVHVTDVKGCTPLHTACRQGSKQCVTLLLNHGADINARSLYLSTPVHEACLCESTDIVRLLLDREVDVNARDTGDRTPLHFACQYANIDTAALLLDRGAVVNVQTAIIGDSPLHVSCMYNKKDAALLLLDRGADVNMLSTYNGQTPLHYACQEETTDTVALLLDRGADVNACDLYHCTPLYFACRRGQTDIVALLLERGADVHAKGCGCTLVDYAQMRGHTDTVLLLQQWASRQTDVKPRD